MKLALFDIDRTIYDGYSGSGIFPFLANKNWNLVNRNTIITRLEQLLTNL